MPIHSTGTADRGSDDGVDEGLNYGVLSMGSSVRCEEGSQSIESRSDAMHRLECEKALLEEQVRQLETQIDETRDGLVDIFNQRISDEEHGSPLRNSTQHAAQFETESAQSNAVQSTERIQRREVTFNELIRVIRSWKRQQESLRLENSQLDALIQELQPSQSHQTGYAKSPQDFQKNIEWLEEAVTSKAEKITELESRLAALEEQEDQLKRQLDSYEVGNRALVKERDAAEASRLTAVKALAEAKSKVKTLQRQVTEKDRIQLQLTTQLTELHALLEKKRRSLNPFKCFSHRPLEKLPELPTLPPPTELTQDDIAESANPSTAGAAAERDLEGSGVTSVAPLLEKQLQSQELHLNELRSQLRREESVRTNLERLLLEGTTLMHSLTSTCKARLREAQSSIQSIQNSTLRQEREPFLIQELENIIQFLDRVKPLEGVSSEDLDASTLFDPPLDPTERRSEPVPIP